MDYQSHTNPYALIICFPGEPTGTQGQWYSFGLFQFLGIFFSNLDVMLWVFILSHGEELFVSNLIPFTQGL